jgi:hypothetical protein
VKIAAGELLVLMILDDMSPVERGDFDAMVAIYYGAMAF